MWNNQVFVSLNLRKIASPGYIPLRMVYSACECGYLLEYECLSHRYCVVFIDTLHQNLISPLIYRAPGHQRKMTAIERLIFITVKLFRTFSLKVYIYDIYHKLSRHVYVLFSGFIISG